MTSPRALLRAALAVAIAFAVAAPARAEWTTSLLFGRARTRDSVVTVSRPAAGTDVRLSRVSWDDESFEAPLYYAVRTGWTGPRVGWDVELTHLKVRARTGQDVHARGTLDGRPVDDVRLVRSVFERLELSHGVNVVLGSAVFRQPVGRTTFVERVGAGLSVPHPESRIGGESRQGYEIGDFAWGVSAGAEIRVSGGWHVTVELKLTRAHESVRIVGGEASMRLDSAHAGVGFTWKSGSRRRAASAPSG